MEIGEIKVDECNFLSVYYETFSVYYNLRSKDDLKLMVKLNQLADKEGCILIPTSIRESICNELGIHTTNLSKSLKRLKENGLVEGDKGRFIINPTIYDNVKLGLQDEMEFTIKFKKC